MSDWESEQIRRSARPFVTVGVASGRPLLLPLLQLGDEGRRYWWVEGRNRAWPYNAEPEALSIVKAGGRVDWRA